MIKRHTTEGIAQCGAALPGTTTELAHLKQHDRQSGFTLIELIVVLTLLGIVLSFVLLTLNRGGREDIMQFDAERLAATIRMIAQESIFSARVLGVDLLEDGYRPQYYDGRRWVAFDSGPLRMRSLAAGLVMSNERGQPFPSKDVPDVVLFPDGELVMPVIRFHDRYSDSTARMSRAEGPKLVAFRSVPR